MDIRVKFSVVSLGVLPPFLPMTTEHTCVGIKIEVFVWKALLQSGNPGDVNYGADRVAVCK